MSRENVELARGGLAAYNAGDLEAVLDLLSPDVEIYSPPEYLNPGTFHGHAGLLEWLGRWLDVWDSFRVEAYDFRAAGDDVVASARQYAKGKDSGLDVEMDVAYLFTFHDGKATRFHIYPGRAEAFEAVGLRA
jgi:ketosteroid isomerase-like protein